MKAGIIAAGLGERFAAAGVATPKPLLRVGDRPLVDRAIAAVAEAGAESVAIIVNEESPTVAAHLREGHWPLPVEVWVQSTPSSMESVFALEPFLKREPFLLSTVDALHAPGDLGGLAARGLDFGPRGALAVTQHIDDEKPLHVRLDEAGEITELGPAAAGSDWITSGVYFFHPVIFGLVAEARRRRLRAFREFLALVLEDGGRLAAHPVGKSLDVDRPEDLEAAEAFVAEVDAARG